MKSYRTLRRWLSAGITLAVLAAVLSVLSWSARPRDGCQALADQAKEEGPAHAWPMFGGTMFRDMVNTAETDVPTEWSVEEGNQKGIKWTADLGSKAYGGPVIADGKVFVGTNNDNPRNPEIKGDKGILLCFRESDGKFLWQAVHDKLEAGRVNDWPGEGICSTPLIEGKRVYYVSNRCEVVCADTEGFLDGKNDGAQDEKYKSKTDADFIWRLDMMKQLGVFPHNLSTCSPLMVGDVLFIVTSNGVDEGHINIPAPNAPSFIAVDQKDGKVLWTSNAPGLKILHGQWSNPVYANVAGKPQIIFPGGDGWLRAYEPRTGKLIWKFDGNPKSAVYKLGGTGTRSDYLATPVVAENRLYIGLGQDPEHEEGVGHFWCIDLERATRFGAENADNDVSPVNDNFDPEADVNKKSALAWHFGGPGDPQKIGRNYIFGRTLSTAAVKDGLVYISELAGYLHCLDAKTGKKYWEHNMQSPCWSSPYWVDGKVYMGDDDGAMFIFAHGKEKKEIGEIDMGGRIRATPTVANGVLFVSTENKLYAIK